MNGSLIERVRERLAAESAPLRPAVVAAAIRAESGGVLGDTEVLSNLRVLETELQRGDLETPATAPALALSSVEDRAHLHRLHHGEGPQP